MAEAVAPARSQSNEVTDLVDQRVEGVARNVARLGAQLCARASALLPR
jgi:hypothetical protein